MPDMLPEGSHGMIRRLPLLAFFRNRAAVITSVTMTSLVAVAVGISMKYGFDSDAKRESDIENITNEAYAPTSVASYTEPKDSISVDVTGGCEAVIFENETLDTILGRIAASYEVRIVIANPDKGRLRLYFKWDRTKTLEEVVAQLDNFEQINIKLDGRTIKVD